MTVAVLATAALAVILLDAHRRRRRQRRERRARLDEQLALIRTDRDRLAAGLGKAVGERASLAVQTASLRRRIDALERDAADWKAIAEGWMRRAVDHRTAPQPVVVDELRQRRDDRGRFTKPAAEAATEVAQ